MGCGMGGQEMRLRVRCANAGDASDRQPPHPAADRPAGILNSQPCCAIDARTSSDDIATLLTCRPGERHSIAASRTRASGQPNIVYSL